MKMHDVRNLFTEQVTRFIAQGYQIYPDTMGGSQGEIAHVDLSNGTMLLRVLLQDDHRGEELYDGMLVITVGLYTESLDNDPRPAIWNHRLAPIYDLRLARITPDWYTTVDESKAAATLRYTRRTSKKRPAYELSDTYKMVALRWLKKQPGMKTCKFSDIEWMRKRETDEGRRFFEIRARGKNFVIQ